MLNYLLLPPLFHSISIVKKKKKQNKTGDDYITSNIKNDKISFPSVSPKKEKLGKKQNHLLELRFL